MKVAYLSVPYSHQDPEVKKQRYDEACKFAAKLQEKNYAVISPIIQGIPIVERHQLKDDYETWKDTCISLINVCDCLIVADMDGSSISNGVKSEVEFARELNKEMLFASFVDGNLEIKKI